MKYRTLGRISITLVSIITALFVLTTVAPVVEASGGEDYFAATVTKRSSGAAKKHAAKKQNKQKEEDDDDTESDDSDVGGEYSGNKGQSGWVKEGRSWFYYVNGETVGEGCRTINGTIYCFEVDGELMTGEVERGGKTYYYTEDGTGMLLKNGITPNGQKTDATGMIYEEADGSSTGFTPTFDTSSVSGASDASPSASYTGKKDSSSSSSGSSSSSSGSSSSSSGSGSSGSSSSSSSSSGGSSSSSGGSSSGSSSGASGSSSSSGEKCIKLAIIKIKGKDCIENSEEAIFEILGMILNIFTFGVGIAATGGFIFCGYQYITSKNEPAVIVKIKTRMLNIVIGLIIYFMFWGLIGLLLPGGLW